jgi:NAD(P)-dependent dehydrogenase (short-subunit alcohol dehydrogenase family)
MSDKGQKVAIITGGSQGIGASLVTAYRRQGWSVVAAARTMKPTEDPYVLTVDGDHPDQKSTSHAQDQRGVSEISPEPGY